MADNIWELWFSIIIYNIMKLGHGIIRLYQVFNTWLSLENFCDCLTYSVLEYNILL